MIIKLVYALLFILFLASRIDTVFADPLPWNSLWEGQPIQYLSIVAAELCGLVAGTVILFRRTKTDKLKTVTTVLASLITSYGIGLVVWTCGHAVGILLYNPINPFFNAYQNPLGPIILLLPEFIGTIIGTLIIRFALRINWKLAFVAMAAAMLVSFLVGTAIAAIYVRSP